MATTGKYLYKQTDNALTTAYQKYTFPDRVRSITIINDAAAGGQSILYSRDGTLDNGEITFGDDVSIKATGGPMRYLQEIFLKCDALPAPDYRLMTIEG